MDLTPAQFINGLQFEHVNLARSEDKRDCASTSHHTVNS